MLAGQTLAIFLVNPAQGGAHARSTGAHSYWGLKKLYREQKLASSRSAGNLYYNIWTSVDHRPIAKSMNNTLKKNNLSPFSASAQ